MPGDKHPISPIHRFQLAVCLQLTLDFRIRISKRKEHCLNLEPWALFIGLVKVFYSAPREALYAVLRRYGIPYHFVKVLIRLYYGAKIKVMIGEVDSGIDSAIGLHQGSCKDPVLFLFIMQAAMETEWPDGVSKPEFMNREYGKKNW